MSRSKVCLHFYIEKYYYKAVQRLPWEIPISEWEENGEHILNLRKGVSRHPVIFVRSNGFEFAIKEISPSVAKKEIAHYEEILKRGVHTLLPIGYVVREEEPISVELPFGIQYEKMDVAYTVTLLASRVLPDSTLFTRAFQDKSQQKIWDAVIELFMELHIHNIYWGDASLANMLIRFDKLEKETGKKETYLRAVMADAETVEIHENISDSMRMADLEFFFESMEWLNEDRRTEGFGRDSDWLIKNKEYILQKYEKGYLLKKKIIEFEKETGIKVNTSFMNFSNPEYINIIHNQILEHKWYLSEKAGEEIPIKEASKDWYENIFCKIRDLLILYEIPEYFQDKNMLDIYIEIMQHKYALGKAGNKDVGFIFAMKDYLQLHSRDINIVKKILSLSRALLKIIGLK